MIIKELLAFLLSIIPLFTNYSLVFFKKENYLPTKYKLVKKVCISIVFFLTRLIIEQQDIYCIHNMV